MCSFEDEYEVGYNSGYDSGYEAGRDSQEWYIEDLQEERNAIEERLEEEVARLNRVVNELLEIMRDNNITVRLEI